MPKACFHHRELVGGLWIRSGTFGGKRVRQICRVCREVLRRDEPWFSIEDSKNDVSLHIDCLDQVMIELNKAKTDATNNVKIDEWEVV